MTIDQIVDKVVEEVTREITLAREYNTLEYVSIKSLVLSYAHDIVLELFMNDDDPETTRLILSHVSDQSLYTRLKQKNGSLSHDEYSNLTNLIDGAENKIVNIVAQNVLSIHMFEIEPVVIEGTDPPDTAAATLPPLHWAAMGYDAAKTQQILEAGGDPNEQDAQGNTCLHALLRYDFGECYSQLVEPIIRLLLETTADVNARNAEGQTPLHLAATNDRLEVAELLLAAGADISAEDNDGNTPLALAEKQEEIMMDNDPTWADTEGESLDRVIYVLYEASDKKTYQLFLEAVKNGDQAKVEQALKEKDIPCLTETYATDTTPLHIAAKLGHDDIVRLLLDAGADADTIAPSGPITPLYVAARSSTIRMLLNAGATVPDYFVDLYDAKDDGTEKFTASTLLEAGISADQRDSSGCPLLQAAVVVGDAAGVKALLAAGADVNARDGSGDTPFHLLCFADDDVIQKMLQAGADLAARNDNGETPLLSVLRRLFDVGGDGEGWLSAFVALLLDAGADVNVKDKEGNTPLHWISRLDGFDAAVAERVIKLTADVNQANSKGETALSIATAEGGPQIVRLLLDAGAVGDTRAQEES